MRVVVSGVASRWDIPLDRLDDVQIAVETVLQEEIPIAGAELTLQVWVSDNKMRLRLDGLTNTGVKKALVAEDPGGPCEGCLLDVRFLLDSLVDQYVVVEQGDRFAVILEK